MLLTDPFRKLWRSIDSWTLRRFGRLDEIRDVLTRTHGKILDVAAVAKMEGINEKQALKLLEEAVVRGVLVKAYLYNSPSTPAPIVINPDEIGRTLKLSELGFQEPDPEQEVTLSQFDTKEIYVSPDAFA